MKLGRGEGEGGRGGGDGGLILASWGSPGPVVLGDARCTFPPFPPPSMHEKGWERMPGRMAGLRPEWLLMEYKGQPLSLVSYAPHVAGLSAWSAALSDPPC